MSNAELEDPKVNEDELFEPPIETVESTNPQEPCEVFSNACGESIKTPIETAESTQSQIENAEAAGTTDESEVHEKESVGESEAAVANDDTIKMLQNNVTKLVEQVAGLGKLFEAKIFRSEHEEKIVDRMHKELLRYKEDMYSQLVRPILLDIIEIRDSILRISSAHLSKPESEQNIPLKTFEMYAFDVQEILEKNNIEIYRSELNSDFIPVRQRVIKKIPTTDENLHGKVAGALSDGYNYMGKTITPERIAVYFYEPQQEQTEPNN